MMDDPRHRRSRFLFNGLLTVSLFLTGTALTPVFAGEHFEESPGQEATSGIASGRVFDWLEFGAHFVFDDHVSVQSDIEVLWSRFVFAPPSGWFYAAEFPVAEVALAPGIQYVSEVDDATLLIYETDWSAGPIDAGELVFFRNQTSGFYAAMRLDWVYDSGGPQALADITWYLQQDGTADFSAFVFLDDFESGDTAFWIDPSSQVISK